MRLISTALIVSAFCLPVISSACGGSNPVDAAPYDTLQLCFDDHHVTEGLPATEAITICCLDHPIGGTAAGTVCGTTAAACTTYVTASLTTTSATTAEVGTGCTDYITQKGM